MARKVKLKRVKQDLTYEELIEITGGAKFRRGESIVKLGGSYFRMFDVDDDPSSPFYKVPIKVIKPPYIKTVRFIISFALDRGKEYAMIEKYKQFFQRGRLYNFFTPAGQKVIIPKSIVDEVVRGLLTAKEYEYSPDGDIVEVMEIKPHPSQVKRDDNYETGLEDFLD